MTAAAVGDGVTNIRQPRLVGFAQPGALVQIINATNSIVASATAAADGSYSAQIASPLNDGIYALRAVMSLAGNASPPSSAFSLSIDRHSPVHSRRTYSALG